MAGPLSRRALVFVAPRRVEIIDEPTEAPPPGHVLAETLVSAISAGTELMAFRGELPASLAIDETLGALRDQTFTYPFRYGYAQVADVVATGEGVDKKWVGRRIFAFAPHASAFTVSAAEAVAIPEGMDPKRAALLAHMETAVNLLLDGRPLLGENVAVIGLGTVGMLATGLLARFPLRALVAVDKNPARARAARGKGPAVVALPPTSDEIRRVLGPRGADLVFELSGNPGALNLAIDSAAHEGRIVVGSWYGGKRAAIALGGAFHRRRLRLISSQVTHIGAELSARWDRARRFETAWSALRDLDPSSIITRCVAFEQARQAFDLLDDDDQEVQQILLVHTPDLM